MKKLFIIAILLIFLSGISFAERQYSTLNLNAGWNVIPQFGTGVLEIGVPDNTADPSALESCFDLQNHGQFIGYLVQYLPNEKQYCMSEDCAYKSNYYPNNSFTNFLVPFQFGTSQWAYTPSSCTMTFRYWPEKTEINGKKLFSGWNFIEITPAMIGKSFTSVFGDCDLIRAHSWDAQGQRWNNALFDLQKDTAIPYNLQWKGLIVKTTSQCTIGGISAVPPLPE